MKTLTDIKLFIAAVLIGAFVFGITASISWSIASELHSTGSALIHFFLR